MQTWPLIVFLLESVRTLLAFVLLIVQLVLCVYPNSDNDCAVYPTQKVNDCIANMEIIYWSWLIAFFFLHFVMTIYTVISLIKLLLGWHYVKPMLLFPHIYCQLLWVFLFFITGVSYLIFSQQYTFSSLSNCQAIVIVYGLLFLVFFIVEIFFVYITARSFGWFYAKCQSAECCHCKRQ